MELINENIYLFRNRTFSSNTYFLINEEKDSCIIIDPGMDSAKAEEELKALNLRPLAIICTHGHFDHIASVSFFQKKYNIPYYIHEKEAKLSSAANFYLKICRINRSIEIPKPDFYFRGSLTSVDISGFKITAYNLPGHTEGSCVIQCNNFIFCGDIMYKDKLGLNQLPGENKLKLKDTIKKIFQVFKGSTLILPGHGRPEILEKIGRYNHELRNFINA